MKNTLLIIKGLYELAKHGYITIGTAKGLEQLLMSEMIEGNGN